MLERILQLYRAQPQNRRANKLYLVVYEVIKNGILNTDLPENMDLPATRALASTINVSRSTVIKAYELLRLEGFIEAKIGSGHLIKPLLSKSTLNQFNDENRNAYPALSETGKAFLSNVTLINSTDDKSVAFRPGLPPLDIFPVTQWKNLSNLYWRNIKLSGLSYSPSSGNEQLKITIANYLNVSRKVKCDPRQIFIVSGSLQSLYLIGNILLNPGESIGIENPTFPNVHSIFKGLRANILPIEIDKEGMLIPDLTIKPVPKLIHVTPSSHYPTGIRMSEQRKKDLLTWVNNHQNLIIENDFEHELCNRLEHTDTLFSMDKNNRTIYISTFNRLLHPSLRIGYMVVPPYLIDPVEALLKHSHRFVAPSIQIVLNQFIEKKYLFTHFKHLFDVTDERRLIFMQKFNELFENQLPIVPSPTESLQLLVHLPNHISDKHMVEYLAKNQIVTHSYSKCFVGPNQKQGLIMGYSSVRAPSIKRKLTQMQKLFSTNQF